MSGTTKLKEACLEDNIPVIEEDSLAYILDLIDERNIKTILELGTAYGYSAINMALVNDSILIDSVERDEKKFYKALKNVKELKLEKQINLFNEDALEFVPSRKYDLIFIDAAKSQNIRFFNRFKDYLNEEGIIITDNMAFHGMVEGYEKIESRNLKAMIRKLKDYISFLEENQEFNTVYIEKGDRLAVSFRND